MSFVPPISRAGAMFKSPGQVLGLGSPAPPQNPEIAFGLGAQPVYLVLDPSWRLVAAPSDILLNFFNNIVIVPPNQNSSRIDYNVGVPAQPGDFGLNLASDVTQWGDGFGPASSIVLTLETPVVVNPLYIGPSAPDNPANGKMYISSWVGSHQAVAAIGGNAAMITCEVLVVPGVWNVYLKLDAIFLTATPGDLSREAGSLGTMSVGDQLIANLNKGGVPQLNPGFPAFPYEGNFTVRILKAGKVKIALSRLGVFNPQPTIISGFGAFGFTLDMKFVSR